MSEWIDINERLPPGDIGSWSRPVLVFNKAGNVYIDYMLREEDGSLRWIYSNETPDPVPNKFASRIMHYFCKFIDGRRLIPNPTHWAAIPEHAPIQAIKSD